MQKLILFALITLKTTNSFAQKKEVYYSSLGDSSRNYYISYTPATSSNGLLILLPGFGESPESADNETDIPELAVKNGWVTIIASLQFGSGTFYADSLSQATLDKLIKELHIKFNTSNQPFYLGGFSLAGAGVLKYAERAYSSDKLQKPSAIFAIDPPLDFERMYTSLEHTVGMSQSEVAKSEARFFLKMLNDKCKGSPSEKLSNYYALSPFSYSDTNSTAIKCLVNCPVLLITEPDINWQIENRNRNYYDLNSTDCAAAINTLKIMGNKNAYLVTTSGKGYRKSSGKRNPHSWSIADADETIKWLIKY